MGNLAKAVNRGLHNSCDEFSAQIEYIHANRHSQIVLVLVFVLSQETNFQFRAMFFSQSFILPRILLHYPCSPPPFPRKH